MHKISSRDGDRSIDWGRTSADYSEFRPDYPPAFYDQLAAHGVGLPRQRILDLGTGVGFLAQEFARRGACVTGVDIASGQIDAARGRAEAAGLSIDYRVAPAERTELPDASFDVITASQCWLYFDPARIAPEVRRLLAPGGVLVTSHFCWLPRIDPIARESEALVLRFNPDWTGGDWAGEIPLFPKAARGVFDFVAMFVFDVDVPFTPASWRGRMRACRGVGASLTVDEIVEFDTALGEWLRATAPDHFTIRHRVDCHIMRPAE